MTPTHRIGDHEFAFGMHGRVCVKCNRRWVDYAPAPREAVGTVGWSCTGALTMDEWESKERELERIRRAVHIGAGMARDSAEVEA